jgi:hypothetical protein
VISARDRALPTWAEVRGEEAAFEALIRADDPRD